MYSQNSEESFILDYFKDTPNGKFIDIGAYDVFKFSNTRALYEKGWSGILIEPSPSNYKSIADHYKDEPRIKVYNVALGETTKEIDFYSCEDAVSTSDIAHKNKWEAAGVPFTKIKVKQVSVADFMFPNCIFVDFLNIDTEATNITIFRNLPWHVFNTIRMLCIEHDGYKDYIEQRLAEHGFSTLYINAENIIMAKPAGFHCGV